MLVIFISLFKLVMALLSLCDRLFHISYFVHETYDCKLAAPLTIVDYRYGY